MTPDEQKRMERFQLRALRAEDELDSLREEESKLRQDINELVSEKVELHAKLARLRETLADLEPKAEALYDENARLREALDRIAYRIYRDGTKMTAEEMRHEARNALKETK